MRQKLRTSVRWFNCWSPEDLLSGHSHSFIKLNTLILLEKNNTYLDLVKFVIHTGYSNQNIRPKYRSHYSTPNKKQLKNLPFKDAEVGQTSEFKLHLIQGLISFNQKMLGSLNLTLCLTIYDKSTCPR